MMGINKLFGGTLLSKADRLLGSGFLSASV
jgi:hypothetical protein